MSNEDWYITAERAEEVKDMDWFSKSDPYLIIKFGGQHVRTRTIKNDRTPYWGQIFHFKLNSSNITEIKIKLMDKDLIYDDVIGKAIISRPNLPQYYGQEQYYKISVSNKKKEITGIVYLKIIKIQRITTLSQPSYQQSSNMTNYPHQQYQYIKQQEQPLIQPSAPPLSELLQSESQQQQQQQQQIPMYAVEQPQSSSYSTPNQPPPINVNTTNTSVQNQQQPTTTYIYRDRPNVYPPFLFLPFFGGGYYRHGWGPGYYGGFGHHGGGRRHGGWHGY